uniref:Uncharacterized protein n=1 Tax=Oryza glumipatula TaxID=40148 RepID=A0A0E0AVG6_9ORYZ
AAQQTRVGTPNPLLFRRRRRLVAAGHSGRLTVTGLSSPPKTPHPISRPEIAAAQPRRRRRTRYKPLYHATELIFIHYIDCIG